MQHIIVGGCFMLAAYLNGALVAPKYWKFSLGMLFVLVVAACIYYLAESTSDP